MKNGIGAAAGLVAGMALAGQVAAKDMSTVDSVNLAEDGKNTISINNPLIVSETRDYTKEAVNLSLEKLKIDVNKEIADNESLQEILEGLKLDKATKTKILEKLEQVIAGEILGVITTDEQTGGSIEIYREGESVTITFSKADNFGKYKKLQLKLENPQNMNSPITVGAEGVSFEYSTDRGVSLQTGMNIDSIMGESARLAGVYSMESVSLGLLADLGPDMYRVVALIGFEVSGNGQLKFLGEHLSQNQEFSSQILGTLEEKITQNKLLVEYKQKISEGFLNYLVFTGYVSSADGKELLDRNITIEDADYISVYREMVSIQGTKGVGVSAGIGLKLNENNKLEVSLNANSINYEGGGTETGFGVKTKYTTSTFIGDLVNGGEVFVKVGVGTGVSQNVYGTGLSVPVGDNSKFSITGSHTQGIGNQENNNTIMASYTHSFNPANIGVTDTRDMTGGSGISQNASDTIKQKNAEMMAFMEDFATLGLIPVKLEEKKELVSRIEKIKPKPKPKPPELEENSETLETQEIPNITTITFVGTTPDTKKAYVGLVLQANTNIKSVGSLISTNGGAISNISISGKQITFDWAGSNAADTFFELTATSTNDTETTTSVRQVLEDLISTPTITLADQTIGDKAGALPTDLPAPSVTNVAAGAVYTIVGNPILGKLTIDANTGVSTWSGDVGGPTDYSITIKVTNPDGGNESTTFNLHVNDNG
ncbi:MAG: hypothetical protein QM490_00490 [Candidatus Gracilibacteria bacterium]